MRLMFLGLCACCVRDVVCGIGHPASPAAYIHAGGIQANNEGATVSAIQSTEIGTFWHETPHSVRNGSGDAA